MKIQFSLQQQQRQAECRGRHTSYFEETDSNINTVAAITKGRSARTMNTPAALCMNLIVSKRKIILSLHSFNRKSLERALTKVHHLYPPLAVGSI